MVTGYAGVAGQVAYYDGTQKSSVTSSEKTTQKTAQKILELIRGNPAISRAELAVQIGITPDGVKYNLDALRKKGALKRVGPDKGGRWEIVEVEQT
jgi:ATP-dependent DNA helicase RecG